MPADVPRGGVLSAAAIRGLLAGERPLVRGLRDPSRQLQPNGVDLTLDAVWRFDGPGALGTEDADRRLPPRVELHGSEDGCFDLSPGPYLARLQEVVDLPTDLMAIGRPRSSLLRAGVGMQNAVWDAGYTGRSEVLLVVYNARGFRVRRGARIVQLVFCRLDSRTTPYRGRFHGENLGESAEPSRPA